MDFASALLLFSSLTCTGVFALWAATSTRHWFLRTAVYVGVLALLLFIPAFEPFLTFIIQGTIVVCGVQFTRWLKSNSQQDFSKYIGFSMVTMLQVVALVAALFAATTLTPELNYRAWSSVVLIGVVAGAVALTSCGVVHGTRFTGWQRVALGFFTSLLSSLLLVILDWLLPSIVQLASWPPEASPLLTAFGGNLEGGLTFVWMPIITSVFCVVCVFLALGSRSKLWTSPAQDQSKHLTVHRIAGVLFIALAITLACPLVYIYYKLVTPKPIPAVEAPDPNGYDDFQSAWEMLPSSLMINSANFDAETATQAQLQQAVGEVSEALDRARTGIQKECCRNIDYQLGYSQLPEIQNCRTLARGFYAAAKLAECKKDYDSALRTYLDLMDYGFAIRRGGLIVDGLIGISCSRTGLSGIYDNKANMNSEQCSTAIEHIKAAVVNAQHFREFMERDRVWAFYAGGWHGRLVQLLSDISEDGSEKQILSAGNTAFSQEQAQMRLMLLELAIYSFQMEYQQLPGSLEMLVPSFLAEIPNDPFDPDSKPFRFFCTEASYVLYSVGQNGKDDGGIQPHNCQCPELWHLDYDGDLRLDLLFEDSEPVAPEDTE